jgi:D-alanyl-D-alanine dipeptidase
VWVRADVARRLTAAAAMLPADLGLLIYDGWRPAALQGELFDRYQAQIAADTGLTGAELEQRTLQFVNRPDHNPDCPPPHLTGGAVDVTLCTLYDDQPVDMGGEFDELSDRSYPRHYERPGLTADEQVFRDRRRLLAAVLTHHGFIGHPCEWFHWSVGDQHAALAAGGAARYGAVLELPRPRRRGLLEVR